MSINQDNHCVIIAGATGLVGSRLLQHILQHDAISTVYALSRRPPQVEHTGNGKVHLLLDPELKITAWEESLPRPTIGFICLGSTRKEAGSRAKLRQVDFELVCHVAQSMKVLGVSKLAVVSSLGADAHSPFHYLKCKGQMENALMQMEFEQLVIARPGPLLGAREQQRQDEKWLQCLMRPITPLLRGQLHNWTPVSADTVAEAMLYRTFSYPHRKIEILHKLEMEQLLSQFR